MVYNNISKIRRIYWYALRLSGFKQLSWNKQFEADVWCRGPNSPYTIGRIEELCNGGVRLVWPNSLTLVS